LGGGHALPSSDWIFILYKVPFIFSIDEGCFVTYDFVKNNIEGEDNNVVFLFRFAAAVTGAIQEQTRDPQN
jgi:hypothetical protein